MPTRNDGKTNVVDNLRHSEYYNLQDRFDDLYQRSSNGEKFQNLMDDILSRENILLAYRNIKTNKGSHTPGKDKVTMKDIAKLTSDEVVEKVRFIMVGSVHGYRPKPVRRKEIPKPDGSLRPLGIPCIWDRIVQQSIKQVLEPICEAKFSNNSYGFRPNRCVEHAIAETHRLLQRSKLGYVVEFDIKGFFDNVNHSKLIRQMWALGIQDKKLIFIIKRILKAPIKMPNGETFIPQKGTPQGGIISPILANIVLNELDQSVIRRYNAMVLGVQGYYNIATDICKDFRIIQHRINIVAKNRLHAKNSRKSKLSKKGRELTTFEKKMYGASKALRYMKSSGEPIYPIGYVKPKPPISKLERVCAYTVEGRKGLHDSLQIDKRLLIELMKNTNPNQSIEFNDNRLSLFSAQMGKCSVTQRIFRSTGEIHCHHKHPKEKGGGDEYANLTLVLETVHKLIHAKNKETINKYLKIINLTLYELEKVNKLREMAGNDKIVV